MYDDAGPATALAGAATTMNDPIPSPTVEQQIERDYRWNFTVNMLDGASFWFGASFISSAIILPLYVSHFTSNPVLIGLIPFLSTAGYLVPQLFVANVVERAPRKKFFPVNLGFFLQRVPIMLLAPTAYLLAGDHPTWALIVFLGLFVVFTLAWCLVFFFRSFRIPTDSALQAPSSRS